MDGPTELSHGEPAERIAAHGGDERAAAGDADGALAWQGAKRRR